MARDPRPPKHLPDSRVAEAGRARDQARSPTRLAPTLTDPLGQLGRELAGRAVRTAGAIEQTRQTRPRLLASVLPAVPPTIRAGETLKAAAACFSVIPPAIADTSA